MGPILFTVFINDIIKCFKHYYFYLFADNLKIIKTIHNNLDTKILQEDIYRLVSWCKQNKMFSSITECQYIQFSCNKKILDNKHYIERVEIERQSTVRDLLVQLNQALKCDIHILSVVSKTFKNIGFFCEIVTSLRSIYKNKALQNAFLPYP